MNLDQQYSTAINSIRLVAAPYETQKLSLPQFVAVSDEIANTFSNAYLLMPQLIISGKINLETASKIKHLEETFSMMTRTESVWNDSSLKAENVWQDCRSQAIAILQSLEEIVEPIDLTYISWVG